MKHQSKRRLLGASGYPRADEDSSNDVSPINNVRVVARDNSQMEGVDFHDVFSQVVKHSSIRALLALAAMEYMELHQLDVKTAFLHGELVYEEIGRF